MSSFDKYFYKQVGLSIRKKRLEEGYTQEQLSELLGLNQKYIGHIERGERKISLKVLVHLLDFFQLLPSEFFSSVNNYIWIKK